VIDPASNTVTATITVPYSARHVAINPLTGRAYVPNFESNTVSVIGR